MNNAVFRKTMENVTKHKDIKLFTTKIKRSYLVSEPNSHTTTFFQKNLLAIEMKKNWNTCEWSCLFTAFTTRIK